MIVLIAKGLRGGGVRFLICASGIAVSTMLVLVLSGAYRGVSTSVIAYTGQRGFDIWVAPKGTDNLMRSSGFLSEASLDEIRRIPGVARVDPIIKAFVTAEGKGGRLTLLGIGLRTPGGLGGPPVLQSGKMPVLAGEVAIDRSAAHRLEVTIGDDLQINGNKSSIVGITSGTNLLATQFVFGNIDSNRSAFYPVASFGIVETTAGAAAPEVATRIRKACPQLEVMTRDAFTENSLREIGAGFRPVLFLISGLGVASAALLVAFLIEGVVEARRAELAVLLAAGATQTAIGAGLLLHAATLLGSGIAAGAASAYLLAYILDIVAPVIQLAYSMLDLLMVVIVLSLAGGVAALVPLVRLRDIDPLEAFRS